MTTTVRVNQTEIRGLFGPAGGVGQTAGRIAHEAFGFARVAAPHRTYHLSESLSLGAAGGFHYTFGGLGNRIELRNSAEYAAFVEYGVDHLIFPKKRGNKLWVPIAPGATRRMRREFVHGQRANPFMRRAMQDACMVHGLSVVLI